MSQPESQNKKRPPNEIRLTGDGATIVSIGGWACAMEVFKNKILKSKKKRRGDLGKGATSMKMEILTFVHGIDMIPRPFPGKTFLRMMTDQDFVAKIGNEILQLPLEEWRQKHNERPDFKEFNALAKKLKDLQKESIPIEIEYMPRGERPPIHAEMDRDSKWMARKAHARLNPNQPQKQSKSKSPEGLSR